MRAWNIQRRVLFIALVPAALVALVLTGYHGLTRIHEAERSTLEQGRSLARHLAPLSEFGVIAGNRQLLTRLAESTVAQDETIVAAVVRDASGNVLAHAADPASAEGDAARSHEHWVRIREPVRRTVLPAFDRPGPSPAEDRSDGPDVRRIGEVEVIVDLGPVRERETALLIESLAISLLALLLTAGVASRIGRTVTNPVQQLTKVVERIRGGDYAARPAVRSGGELGSLEIGVAEMAAEIEQSQSRMQRRVEQATAELQNALDELAERNAELDEARRAAEATSEFKSRFLANISHEIRTPMNSILGFTELLRRADMDSVEADYLETIHNSARSLLDLLNGILDLSKIESGRMELMEEDTDVNALFVEVFRLLGPQAMHKGLDFLVEPVPRPLARVHTDPLRLKQVLINLVSNAVKFTDEGRVRLRGQAWEGSAGSIGLCLCVDDTGCGIPAAAQRRLFQAFAQGRDETHGDGVGDEPGTGLGLHIASEIVFMMGGSIEFRSEPGEGSSFWVMLDLPAASPAPEPTEAAEPRATLLLVARDDEARHAHAAVLRHAGYAVETAEPAADGTGPIEAEAVICDVPARDVRAGEIEAVPDEVRIRGRPVLALAHIASSEARGRLLAAGFDDIVTKTPDPQALQGWIDPWLRGAGPEPGRRESAASRPLPQPAARHVLIVDDHPINRKLFETYLADRDIAATSAGSSEEALELAAREAYDVILLDIHLPDRDGFETVRLLRAGEGPSASAPVIAITADALHAQSEGTGLGLVLVKPVSQHQLLESIARCCGRAGGSAHQAAGETAGGERVSSDARRRPPALDPEDARQRAGGRAEVARELFGMLQQHLPESRRALHEAHSADDNGRLREEAHRLRGAAAYCGVPRLQAAVAALERAAREGADDSVIAEALGELDAAIEELLAARDPIDEAD